MPTIHIIDGIKIEVLSRDHNPPHFHAYYSGGNIAIEIKTLETMMKGEMPAKQLKKIKKWAKENEQLLLDMFRTLNPKLR